MKIITDIIDWDEKIEVTKDRLIELLPLLSKSLERALEMLELLPNPKGQIIVYYDILDDDYCLFVPPNEGNATWELQVTEDCVYFYGKRKIPVDSFSELQKLIINNKF